MFPCPPSSYSHPMAAQLFLFCSSPHPLGARATARRRSSKSPRYLPCFRPPSFETDHKYHKPTVYTQTLHANAAWCRQGGAQGLDSGPDMVVQIGRTSRTTSHSTIMRKPTYYLSLPFPTKVDKPPRPSATMITKKEKHPALCSLCRWVGTKEAKH